MIPGVLKIKIRLGMHKEQRVDRRRKRDDSGEDVYSGNLRRKLQKPNKRLIFDKMTWRRRNRKRN